MKNPPATFTDPDVVLPVVAAPTVRMLLESVEPPIEFEVVDAFDNEPADEKYIVLVAPAPK
jgi:hypothetical protein